ncbi:MAG: group II intron reverse transcriptase/maturase [Bacteriovoracaceae bacterium]|nr:group II intron reverse transcriptase/maturase [Bacteriovoracaceae bacterium]
MSKTKPFSISKKLVWEAYVKVRRKKGAAGIDAVSLEKFNENLKDNLYKIWNKMSSGSYFPPPVKSVAIPKNNGGERILGIPTISDRIAQTVVKLVLEPEIDPHFYDESYGYRPGRSALDAVGEARKNCWSYNWVIDLDIKGFFDNLNHDLVMKAVKHHTDNPWAILYIERWLKSSIVSLDGEIRQRNKGTPQGGVISPLIANLFLHYGLDHWLKTKFPRVKFERYADDAVIHCSTLREAKLILNLLKLRMRDCGLELHPEKTKIVYCADWKRNLGQGFEHQFDFLGFTFKRRTAKGKTGLFDGFQPAISKSSLKKISLEIKSWKMNRATHTSLNKLSAKYNPKIRGWVNYYGKFYPRELRPINRQLRAQLNRWARRKYKRFKGYKTNAGEWMLEVSRRDTKLFAIWEVFGGI